MPVSRQETPNAKSASRSPVVVLSRRWATLLVAALLAPWLVVGAAVVFRGAGAPAGVAGPSPAAAGTGILTTPAQSAGAVLPAGPWGDLRSTAVIVSPPLEYVSIDLGPVAPPAWRFPGVSRVELESFLGGVGVDSSGVAVLRRSIESDPRGNILVVKPDAALVRGLRSEARARLYGLLARTPFNRGQAHPYRFAADSIDAWLGRSTLAPETRALVEPLVYRDGGVLYFADLDLVRPAIQDPAELRRLVKVLSRQPTMVMRLSVGDSESVDELAEYWGRGGRRLDLRPLLESVAGRDADAAIDIIHLLPTMARHHLYRYPRLTAADFDRPIIANCLWTALNFFRAVPDDRYLDVTYALEHLKRDYHVIEDGFQLGDVVALLDERGSIFHASVYIAAGVVLTKNGTSPLSPWVLAPLGEVQAFYRVHAPTQRLIYHRPNGL